MIEFQGVSFYKEENKIIAEFGSNTIKFFGFTATEAAAMVRKLIEDSFD